uniref:Uncharacterized protein n=1 Tax=Anguilla anguilla TaxID=7936 RepID=A0A0E9XP45_ANGAN
MTFPSVSETSWRTLWISAMETTSGPTACSSRPLS